MNRHERLMRLAYKASLQSDSRCAYSIGAVVAKGNKVISFGANSTKSHPKNPELDCGSRLQLHAELDAVLKALHFLELEDLSNCVVYVTRRTRTRTMTISKPCKYCRTFMRSVGIRKVYYTNREGVIEELIL